LGILYFWLVHCFQAILNQLVVLVEPLAHCQLSLWQAIQSLAPKQPILNQLVLVEPLLAHCQLSLWQAIQSLAGTQATSSEFNFVKQG
jgi:hypothetical protein